MTNNIMQNWYMIPGFTSYNINYYTREVRSCKHFNCGFHIMTKKEGKVTLTDDSGKSRRVKVDYLYDLTFNSGNELKPRGDYEMWCGGMRKENRSLEYLTTPVKKEKKYVIPKLAPNGFYTE